MNFYETDSYYGGHYTRTFTQIFETAEDFLQSYKECGIPALIKETTATTLYFLLCARHANSPIASSDENRFLYQLFSIVWQYGPTWERRLEIQEDLRKMSLEDLQLGSIDIFNTALNPATAPSGSLTLDYINQQNTSQRKRSKIDAYANLLAFLDKDVSEEFLNKFNKLFSVGITPQIPLMYETEVSSND